MAIDAIKHRAHKEAWSGKSSNPFRRTRSNASDAGPGPARDTDAGVIFDAPRRISSEPLPQRINGRDAAPYDLNDATSPTTFGTQSTFASEKSYREKLMSGARPAEQSNEGITVDAQPSGMGDEQGRTRAKLVGRKKKGKKFEITISSTSKTSLKHKPFALSNQLRATLLNSWINVLLIAAPLGIALHYVPSIPPLAIFLINFVAIIPLAALLSFATEEIALRVGEVLGGLLNATFGNAVELIVSTIALTHQEVIIVKTSLIGSILSNLLLVMGMCFFFGGLRRSEQFFNVTVATTAASLLALAIASIVVPTAFDQFTTTTETPIAALSRGTAIILLVVYGCYLYFQLGTHSEMYQVEGQKVAKRPRKNHIAKGSALKGLALAGALSAAPGRAHPIDQEQLFNTAAFDKQQATEGADEPQLHIWVAVGTLAASTAVIAICAEFMIGSIGDFTNQYGVSAEFVGLILLPIIGNAAEHATAVTVAYRDKMDLAIGVAVGSSMQVALLIIPLMVILGWILGNDEMNLSFDGFQIAVLFVSVLLVNYLIGDGKSNWLEGVLLQCLYMIIAVTAWYYPPASLTS